MKISIESFCLFFFFLQREEATKKYEIQLQQLITLEEQDREKEKKAEDQTKQYQLYKVGQIENLINLNFKIL
jgi:hypothetical protein